MRRELRFLLFAGLLAGAGCASHQVVPIDLLDKGAAVKRPRCNARRTIRRLSLEPQQKLDQLDRSVSAITTKFKEAGVSGWIDTGCDAEGAGVAVRDAAHSDNDFWTIDVQLSGLRIGKVSAPEGRFLRLEVWPKTPANAVADRARIRKGTRLAFSGPVVIDEDGPFLEIHPGEGLRVLR
ncbi:MAG TPA: hypothetical protein VIY96_04030 [Thermoanaerobaculia bacterium]